MERGRDRGSGERGRERERECGEGEGKRECGGGKRRSVERARERGSEREKDKVYTGTTYMYANQSKARKMKAVIMDQGRQLD